MPSSPCSRRVYGISDLSPVLWNQVNLDRIAALKSSFEKYALRVPDQFRNFPITVHYDVDAHHGSSRQVLSAGAINLCAE
jgi:hypothetical protein